MEKKQLATYVRAISIFIFLIAVLVLTGWRWNIDLFKKIVPGYLSMNPLTAVCFILIAIWLWYSQRNNKGSPLLKSIPVILLLIACSKLSDTFLHTPFHLDLLLFRSKLQLNEISVSTALDLLIIAIILFLPRRQKISLTIFNFLMLFSILLSVISLFGYLFNLQEALTIRPFVPMALNSAVLFLLVNVGLAITHSESIIIKPFLSRYLGGVAGRKMLPYALLVPIGLSWIRYRGEQQSLFGREMGVTLLTAATTFIFLVLIWSNAKLVNRIDKQRVKSLERFRFANLATSDSIFEWNLTSTSGWEVPAMGNPAIRFDLMHPEDIEHVRSIIQQAHADPETSQYSFEYRSGNLDKTYKHYSVKNYIIREGGKAVKVIGAVQDVSEIKNLQTKLLQQEKRNKVEIVRSVIEAQEKERVRLSLDLTENINQVLSSSKMMLELALTDKKNAQELTQRSFDQLTHVIDQIEVLSNRLNPSTLADIGLEEAIREMIDSISPDIKIKINFTASGISKKNPLSTEDKIAIFRIIQEQVSNICRHSNAEHATITLRVEHPLVYITIVDDGNGFDKSIIKYGLGFQNIIHRVEYYNGKMIIDTAPGKGCRMEMELEIG